MSGAITVDQTDGIYTLTIDQADSKVNVLNRLLWEEFAERLADLAGRPNLRGVMIRSGKPGMFIAGADLREIAAIPLDDQSAVRALVKRGQDVLATLEALPCPTVALIDGPALGGGLEVALACDFRLVGIHPKVALGLPEVKLGLIPGWGGTQRLTRIIGPAKALQMIATGEPVNAHQADDLGLVHAGAVTVIKDEIREQIPEAVDCDQLPQFAEDYMRNRDWAYERKIRRDPFSHGVITSANLPEDVRARISGGEAAGVASEVIAAGCRVPLSEALAIETEAFVRLVGSIQAREKIAAFFNRAGRK